LIRFTVYSRSWCHLCEDMLTALRAFPIGEAHAIEVLDVDADAALLARYDELVPVLMAQRTGETEQQICHYHLDPAALQAYLA
jgi:hypothetical protein